MVLYTFAQCPSYFIEVPGKDSDRTRFAALKQLCKAINNRTIDIKLPKIFYTSNLIELDEVCFMSKKENDITEAVKKIAKLAQAKSKMDTLHHEALDVYSKIDCLFSEKPISNDKINTIIKKLDILQNFAKASLRYQEAKTEAQKAKQILDDALKEVPE